MNETIITAVISAFTGGSILKLLEFWLSRSKQKNESDKAMRDELRAEAERLRKEIEDLKKELKTAEVELDEWKVKYWTTYMNYSQFKLTVFGILLQNGIRPEDVLPPEKEGSTDATPA